MKTICIVSCGIKKIWDKNPGAGPTKAKEVYVGPFSKKCQQYAEKFYAGSWCILSAKYGFLLPDEVIPGPYNVSFNNKKTNPISLKDLSRQLVKKNIDEYNRIIVLDGKKYTEIAKLIFIGKTVLNPLSSCKGIGYMMGKLNDAIVSNKCL